MMEARVDRAPGLSARLKLTLSYAGFLVLAGVVLLGAAWVFLSNTNHLGLIIVPHYRLALVPLVDRVMQEVNPRRSPRRQRQTGTVEGIGPGRDQWPTEPNLHLGR